MRRRASPSPQRRRASASVVASPRRQRRLPGEVLTTVFCFVVDLKLVDRRTGEPVKITRAFIREHCDAFIHSFDFEELSNMLADMLPDESPGESGMWTLVGDRGNTVHIVENVRVNNDWNAYTAGEWKKCTSRWCAQMKQAGVRIAKIPQLRGSLAGYEPQLVSASIEWRGKRIAGITSD